MQKVQSGKHSISNPNTCSYKSNINFDYQIAIYPDKIQVDISLFGPFPGW